MKSLREAYIRLSQRSRFHNGQTSFRTAGRQVLLPYYPFITSHFCTIYQLCVAEIAQTTHSYCHWIQQSLLLTLHESIFNMVLGNNLGLRKPKNNFKFAEYIRWLFITNLSGLAKVAVDFLLDRELHM